MKRKADSFAELSELLGRLRDGEITDEEFAHLDKLLAGNAQYQKYYIDYILLCSELRNRQAAVMFDLSSIEHSFHKESSEQVTNASETGDFRYAWQELAEYEKLAPSVEIERNAGPAERILTQEEQQARIRAFLAEEKAMEEQERMLAELERRKVRRQELQRRKRSQQMRTVLSKMRKVLKIGAAAAVVMVVAFYLYALLTPVPPAFVATLTDGADIKWADSRQPAEPGSQLEPGTMKLVEGYARITFNEGASVILQAPCSIDLQDTHKVFLESGKLSAEVPVQARGFKINTPSASITDLGTEFGVRVAEDGTSDIYVFKGRVSLLAGRFDNMVGRLFDTVEQIVEAGQARRVKTNSSKTANIPFEKEEFVRDIPFPYELAIRKTGPIAYWDFNLNESRCRNQIGGKIKSVEYSQDVLRTNNGPKLSGRAENGALTILHQRPPTMRLVDVPLFPHTPSGYTIMFWYQPLVSSPHTIITHDLGRDQPDDFGRWFYREINGKLSFGTGVGMNYAEEYQIIESNKPLPLDQWTFVVVTITPQGRGRLYINGRRESSNAGYEYRFEPETRYADIVFGFFGNGQDESFTGIEEGKPTAIIDELALYDYPLSENTIRQLYNCFQPEPGN